MPKYHDEIATGGTYCDWLTLTTFNSFVAGDLAGCLQDLAGDGVRDTMKRMQYSGFGGAQWFVGAGDQGGMHWLINVSGTMAQKLMDWIDESHYTTKDIRCKRIDIQVTVPIFPVDLVATGCLLREGKMGTWLRQGPEPGVHFHADITGLDTLYLGSRKSRVMLRIYIKEVAGRRFIRFEAEYKRETAQAVWDIALEQGIDGIRALLAGQFTELPASLQTALTPIWDAIAGEGGKPVVILERTSEEKTFLWIREKVLPAIGRLLLSRYGTELKELLDKLLTK